MPGRTSSNPTSKYLCPRDCGAAGSDRHGWVRDHQRGRRGRCSIEDDDFWTGPEHLTKELHEALGTRLTQEMVDEDVQAIKSYQLLPTTSDVDEQVPQSEDADESSDHLLTPEEIHALTDLGEAKMHLLRYEKAYRNITQACTKRRRDESTDACGVYARVFPKDSLYNPYFGSETSGGYDDGRETRETKHKNDERKVKRMKLSRDSNEEGPEPERRRVVLLEGLSWQQATTGEWSLHHALKTKANCYSPEQHVPYKQASDGTWMRVKCAELRLRWCRIWIWTLRCAGMLV